MSARASTDARGTTLWSGTLGWSIMLNSLRSARRFASGQSIAEGLPKIMLILLN